MPPRNYAAELARRGLNDWERARILKEENTQLRIQVTKTRKENDRLKAKLGAIYLETELGAHYLARQLRLDEDDPPTL